MSTKSTSARVRVSRAQTLLEYLSNIRSLDRTVRLFLTITAFRGLVIATLATVLNLYLYSLGYDARFIGLINGINAGATLLASIALGFVADRVGRRPVLLVGGILYPLSILGLGFAQSTTSILVLYFLFGGVASSYWVAGVPLLVESTTPPLRVQVFSINSFLLWGLGPFGAFFSGQFVELVSRALHVSSSSSAALRGGIFFMAALAIAGAIPYPFLHEQRGVGRTLARQVSDANVPRLFFKLLLPDVILTFGGGAILTFIQLYFHLRFGLGTGAVGSVMALGGLVAGVGTLCVPLMAHRWGNLRTTVALQWAVVPSMAVLAFATQLAVAMPAYWLMLTVRSMFDPVYTAFAQEQVPEVYRGRLTGLYSATYSIGYSLGPAASGQLQHIGGFSPAFLLGTFCYVCGATLLYVFFGRTSQGAQSSG
ncbi:MAG: hypothetical protein NVS4B2_18950 [Chloroflexota bacterium]